MIFLLIFGDLLLGQVGFDKTLLHRGTCEARMYLMTGPGEETDATFEHNELVIGFKVRRSRSCFGKR